MRISSLIAHRWRKKRGRARAAVQDAEERLAHGKEKLADFLLTNPAALDQGVDSWADQVRMGWVFVEVAGWAEVVDVGGDVSLRGLGVFGFRVLGFGFLVVKTRAQGSVVWGLGFGNGGEIKSQNTVWVWKRGRNKVARYGMRKWDAHGTC